MVATRQNYLFQKEGETQFLIFRPGCWPTEKIDGNTIFGSGFSLEAALDSAVRSYRYEQLTPEHFSQHLGGYTFSKIASKGVVLTQCANPLGVVIATASGKEEAAKHALHHALIDAEDVSLEDFAEITVVAQVDRGGRGTYGLTFSDLDGQGAIRNFISRGYRDNATFDLAGKSIVLDGVTVTSSEPTFSEKLKAVQGKIIQILLSSKPDADLHIFSAKTEDGLWEGNILLHSSRLTAKQALNCAYQEFIESRKSTEQPVPSPTC